MRKLRAGAEPPDTVRILAMQLSRRQRDACLNLFRVRLPGGYR